MKKVMIGVLILIPVIILLVLAAVSGIVSVATAVGVEEVNIHIKTGEPIVLLKFKDVNQEIQNFYQYVDIEILPKKANSYSTEFSISNIVCTDDEFDGEDEDAVYMVDIWKNNKRVSSNTTGDFAVKSYCYFTVNVKVETIIKSFNVQVVGYDVKKITLTDSNNEDSSSLTVGESLLIYPSYNPIDSIIKETTWSSSDNNVAVVDKNGVVTAKSLGSAKITMQTFAYSDTNKSKPITSLEYEVNVENGASLLFGNVVNISKNTTTLAELGLSDCKSSTGCDVVGTTISNIVDGATITTMDNKTLTIYLCESNDIVIENESIYDADNNFVFEVGDLKLSLTAVYKDKLKSQESLNATWTSSNEDIATIDQSGLVTALKSGLVTITASFNGKQASIKLNVQNKVTALSLSANNAYLPSGLAQETVFASERFNESLSSTYKFKDLKKTHTYLNSVEGEAFLNSLHNFVEENYTTIRLDGEPMDATEEEMEFFYSAYNFEVVDGSEYAEFESNTNKLVFKPALEKQGKQKIQIKVSAKYPKYISMTKFTTAYADIYALYGVEVDNFIELKVATFLQYQYSKKDGNLHPAEIVDSFTDEKGNKYNIQNAEYSDYNYGISLMGNCPYELEYDGNGNMIANINNDDGSVLVIYGDVYGNNHRISVVNNQIAHQMIKIGWGNVTFSNVQLRGGEVTGENISKEEVTGLESEMLEIYEFEHYYNKYHMSGVTIEYSLFENGWRAINIFGTDTTINGCVFRNFKSSALHVPIRFRTNDAPTQEEMIYYPVYSHVNVKNCVVSNTLASLATIQYEHFSITEESSGSNHVYRFAETKEANDAFLKTHFIDKGYNLSFHQLGFLDVYNWTPTTSANIIDTGIEVANNLIGSYGGAIIESNYMADPARYHNEEDNLNYFSLVFLTNGVADAGNGVFNEPIYADLVVEDPRIGRFNLTDLDTSLEANRGDAKARLASVAVKAVNINIELFYYLNTSDITPKSVFKIDQSSIARLHQQL